jgi:hypothetical protein
MNKKEKAKTKPTTTIFFNERMAVEKDPDPNWLFYSPRSFVSNLSRRTNERPNGNPGIASHRWFPSLAALNNCRVSGKSSSQGELLELDL